MKRQLLGAGTLVLLVCLPGFVSLGIQTGHALGQERTLASQERTVWYFYRVKWGFQDSFIDLYQKNHQPILNEHLKSGRLTNIKTYIPKHHGDGRADWTFAVELTFRDDDALMRPSGEDEIIRRLYPDQTKFREEERYRFELLDAHWDVPLSELDLNK